MATSDKLEHTISGGIAGIKGHMKNTQNTIKEKNATAERMEKENEQARKNYARATGRIQAMRDKITEKETKLEKCKDRITDMNKRLQEKERFLEESVIFHKKLKTIVPEEGALSETEGRLKGYKEMYSKNYERYSKAKERKCELEQSFEQIEIRAQDFVRRVGALKLELEYNLVEEARRTEGCKQSIDAAFKSEKQLLDLQRGLDVLMKRKEAAMQKNNSLESQISKTEDSLDNVNFERRRIEATIRELLINIKGQAESENARGKR